MKIKKSLLAVAGCSLVLCFTVVTAVSASSIGDAVKTACTKCHSSKRICLMIGAKDKTGWKATVKMMVGKGAQLDPSRIDAAADYLAGLAPGTGTVCQ